MTHLYTGLAAGWRLLLVLVAGLLALPGRAQSVSSFAPATGPAGTPVTITGSDLDKVTGVRFGTGDLTLNFVSQSATRLTVLVPVVAATGPLVLTNAAGAMVSTATAFTYTPRLNLAATLSPAGPLDVCEPRTLTATAAFPAFATSAASAGIVYRVVVQADGQVLVGGGSFYNSQASHYLLHLRADGSLDPDFNTGQQSFNASVTRMAVQADGKIVVGGSFTSYNGTPANYLLRLRANGSLDPDFNTGKGFNGDVYSLAVQADGQVLVGGYFTSYDSQPASRLVRLRPDGSRDLGFNAGGVGFDGTVSSLAVQADGKVLVGGQFTSYNGQPASYLVRLHADGSRDATFTPATGFNAPVNSVVVQADGRVLVGGQFNSDFGMPFNHLARLRADGSRDTDFNLGKGCNDEVASVAVQSDGQVLVSGRFTSYNGKSANRLLRLHADGSPDTGFTTGTGFDGVVYSVAVQADGQVLAGGYFAKYNNQAASSLLRLHPDGSLNDTATLVTGASFTFAPGGSTTNPLVVSTPGTYTATASLNGETSAPSNAVVLTACALATAPATPAGAALRLYPNPAPGAALLSGTAPGAAVRVLDALGRTVATATADAGGAARLPAGLAPGVYVVRAGGAALRWAVE